METITTTTTVYTFDELNETAKDNVRQWFICQRGLEFFAEDIELEFKEKFPNSDLKIALSWLCCQGDGVNIHGKIYLEDFLPHWDASEKEKRRMRYYLNKGLYLYEFTAHNRYTYSCKFIDADALPGIVDDFIYSLPDIRDIDAGTIEKFYSDMFDFFGELDSAIFNDLWKYIYNVDDDEISEFCDANEIYFDEDGTTI